MSGTRSKCTASRLADTRAITCRFRAIKEPERRAERSLDKSRTGRACVLRMRAAELLVWLDWKVLSRTLRSKEHRTFKRRSPWLSRSARRGSGNTRATVTSPKSRGESRITSRRGRPGSTIGAPGRSASGHLASRIEGHDSSAASGSAERTAGRRPTACGKTAVVAGGRR